jgi:hypothetical protein
VREAFKDLLKEWARDRDLVFIPEFEITTLTKERRYVAARFFTLYESHSAIGKRRIPATNLIRRLKRNSAAAIRRTTSFLKIRSGRS